MPPAADQFFPFRCFLVVGLQLPVVGSWQLEYSLRSGLTISAAHNWKVRPLGSGILISRMPSKETWLNRGSQMFKMGEAVACDANFLVACDVQNVHPIM